MEKAEKDKIRDEGIEICARMVDEAVRKVKAGYYDYDFDAFELAELARKMREEKSSKR